MHFCIEFWYFLPFSELFMATSNQFLDMKMIKPQSTWNTNSTKIVLSLASTVYEFHYDYFFLLYRSKASSCVENRVSERERNKNLFSFCWTFIDRYQTKQEIIIIIKEIEKKRLLFNLKITLNWVNQIHIYAMG